MENINNIKVVFSIPDIFWFNPIILAMLNNNNRLLAEVLAHNSMTLDMEHYKDLIILFQGMHSTNEANELEKRYLNNISIQ